MLDNLSIMTEVDNQLPLTPELLLPNDISLTDRFWINPTALGSVTDVINSAHITTMALGVESRQDEFTQERLQVKQALLDVETPQTKEEGLALEVGFLYGVMLARSEQSGVVSDPQDLLQGFVERLKDAKEGLDLTTKNDCHVYFMRLRDVEVEFTGSDVLAYCLASTQDHIAQIFSTSNKDTADSSFTDAETTRLQSLYYAGALSGALIATNKNLPGENIQIMRSKRASMEPVSVQLQLDPSDDLEEAINYQLRNRYIFTPVKSNNRRGIAITPGGLQFGPNAQSMPVYLGSLSDPGDSYVVPTDKLDAIIVEMPKEDLQQTAVRVVRGDKAIRRFIDNQNGLITDSGTRIKAVIAKGHLVSAYDAAHPWSSSIDEFIGKELGIKRNDIRHCDEVELWKELKIDESVNPIGRKVLVAALVSVFAVDAIESLSNHSVEVAWSQDLVAAGLVIGVIGLAKWIGKKFQRDNRASARQYDTILQELLDKTTLPKQTSSGNISD